MMTEIWPNVTNEDGTGLFFELTKAIYSPLGIPISFTVTNYRYALLSLYESHNTMLYGVVAYQNPMGEIPLSVLPIHNEKVYFVCPINIRCNTKSLTAKTKVAVPKGYSYRKILNLPGHFQQALTFDHNLELLSTGRVDMLVTNEYVISQIKARGLFQNQYQYFEYTAIPNYVGFSQSEQGLAMRDVFNKRFKVLLKSGALKKMYKRWNLPFPKQLEQPQHFPVLPTIN